MAIFEDNKKLIEEFPFLLPRNRFSDKVDEDYDYSFTELDAMPEGWRKAFGIQMCKEIKEALQEANYLEDYRILEIKEKFGGLRWYDNGAPQSVHDIINKYETVSQNTCYICGKPAKWDSLDWICPWCDDCAKKYYEDRFPDHKIAFDKIFESHVENLGWKSLTVDECREIFEENFTK